MAIIGAIKNGIKTKVAAKLPNLFPASRTTYDNTSSGLSANRVQGAIDEVNTNVSGKVSKSGDTMSGTLTLGSGNRGELDIKSSGGTYTTRIYNSTSNPLTANRVLYIPDRSGTLCVKEDATTVGASEITCDNGTVTGNIIVKNNVAYFNILLQRTDNSVNAVLTLPNSVTCMVYDTLIPSYDGWTSDSQFYIPCSFTGNTVTIVGGKGRIYNKIVCAVPLS